jgi:hypothetical protein
MKLSAKHRMLIETLSETQPALPATRGVWVHAGS